MNDNNTYVYNGNICIKWKLSISFAINCLISAWYQDLLPLTLGPPTSWGLFKYASGFECTNILNMSGLSSGATSSIFHPHAAKNCCAAYGYRMLHVAHPLNNTTNSIFAAFFCFLTIKYSFATWFPRGPRAQQIFVKNFMFII